MSSCPNGRKASRPGANCITPTCTSRNSSTGFTKTRQTATLAQTSQRRFLPILPSECVGGIIESGATGDPNDCRPVQYLGQFQCLHPSNLPLPISALCFSSAVDLSRSFNTAIVSLPAWLWPYVRNNIGRRSKRS